MTPVHTQRLTLRQLIPDDLDDLVALDADPEVMRYLTGGVPTPRRELTERLPQWIADGSRLAAVDRQRGSFVGWFGLGEPAADHIVGVRPGDLELGYRLCRAEWGQGYATEGARALIGMAFLTYKAPRVIATTMTVNLASRRVMEKAGLRHLSTFHLAWDEPIPGAEAGDVLYGLGRDEWRAGPQ